VGPRAVGAYVNDRVEERAIETAVAEGDVPDTVLGQRREDVRVRRVSATSCEDADAGVISIAAALLP
jgi:hypothetical protein